MGKMFKVETKVKFLPFVNIPSQGIVHENFRQKEHLHFQQKQSVHLLRKL